MKHIALISLCITAVLTGCNADTRRTETGQQENSTAELARRQIQTASFEDLFKSIDAKNVRENISTLVNGDLGILTAVNASRRNSMVTNWGGWGALFDKPVVFSFISNQYATELIRKENSYTITFFGEAYKDDILQYEKLPGRDSNEKKKKNKRPELIIVRTPAGNIAFKEAKLIIECKFFKITSVSPDDLPTGDAREPAIEAHSGTGEYNKTVFGEVTNVWVRK